ncbi:hypothetical protein TNCV_3260721 [Trichonephila clavipes]|nr:hypothetical protein TNCV_3260721 [Trichonephila clavipes]
MRMKAEQQKHFQEERCKRMDVQNQLLNEEQEKPDEDIEVPQAIEKIIVFKREQAQILSMEPDAVAQTVTVEKKKGLSNVLLISAKDEIEEEKPKLPERKLKKLSRMTVAKLQRKLNLKASSNIILIPQHWSFKHTYLQDKGGIEKLAYKLPDFIK